MAKPQRRKPKRRTQALSQRLHKPGKVDSDWVALAKTIDEFRLEQNAAGWFSVPWRDGRHAADLALDGWWKGVGSPGQSPRSDLLYKVQGLIWGDISPTEAYWAAGDLLAAEFPLITTVSSGFLHAALRIVQVKIAGSDGGGYIYNEILRPVFEACDGQATSELGGLVEHHRCMDALGSYMGIQRYQLAFQIAWRRGLFKTAYLIPDQFAVLRGAK